MLQSGIPYDTTNSINRSYEVLEKLLDLELGEPTATRKMKEVASETDDGESILKKQHKDIKSQSHHTDRKVVKEFTVSGKE